VGRVVHIAKTLLAWVVVGTGLLRIVQGLRRPHVLVLAYHRVTPDATMERAATYPAMHVATSTFAAQLAALRRLYRVVPTTELRRVLADETPLRENLAVITFDDGYRDNYRNALPILAAQGVPATFFLSMEFIDRGEPFWFDRLAAAARTWDADPARRARASQALPPPLVAAWNAPHAAAERLRRVAAYLKRLSDAERAQVIDAIQTHLGGDLAADAAPLAWEEIQALRDAGMQLGAHGMRHAILTRLEPAEAAREIRDSVSLLARRVGTPVRAFAYPNGDADTAVARLAAAAGVDIAFTMEARSLRPGDDLLRLGRRNVCEASSRDACGRFSRAYFWCEITGVFDCVLRRGRRSK
jgi:peptidoglycan/xylan/chitin deacetylase (PgdA/CDA1 family)